MSYESPEARMSVAHALYNASCAGECTRIFAALPKIQRDRWGKLADYLHEIVSEKDALRQRCEELERVLRLVAPHIGFTLPLEATRSLAAEARKVLRGGA